MSIALAPNTSGARAQATRSVAYFCCEFAIEDDLPIYAGGLGVLAGDLVLEAGQMGLDFTAIGLYYGGKSPEPYGFRLEPISLSHSKIWSKFFGTTKLYLLDGGKVTNKLYDPDPQIMLRQQLLLGFDGIELLGKLNKKIDIYHLNEGHTAFVILALEKAGLYDKNKIVATKHTILPVGLHLSMEQLGREQINAAALFPLGQDEEHPGVFSTTQYLLNFSGRASAVSQAHAQFEKKAHPGSNLIPITNGVHFPRWQSKIDHQSDKKTLIDLVNQKTDSSLSPTRLTLVWARRLVPYKRPELLLQKFPDNIQVIIMGRPDDHNPQVVEEIRTKIQTQPNLVFLPQYNLEIAKMATRGADVWVNIPIPGEEACGTSGMKAGLNGALMLSTNDGWVVEQSWEQVGWILVEENIKQRLYATVTEEIAPMYYQDKIAWQERMIKTKEIILKNYSTKRVLEDYQNKLYC